MAYEKQIWNQYDALKTEEENIENGAVVTDNRMNHIEEGIEAHTADLKNPHKVTAAQVGLGNVQNFGLATEDEAKQGTSNAKYMTPSLTQAVLSANINSIAYANSADGTNGFTTVYPNLNLLKGTKTPKSITGNNTANQQSLLYSFDNNNTLTNQGFSINDTLTLEFDWNATNPASGYFILQWQGAPWSFNLPTINLSSTNGSGHVVYTFNVSDKEVDSTAVATGIGYRLDNVPTNTVITFSNVIVRKTKSSQPWMPSSSEVTTADWPKYIGFSNTVKTNKSASDYTWFPVKDSELTNKVESHINNKSNPHGVTASQVGAYSKTEADSKLALKANDSEVVHNTGDETIAGNKNFTGSISYPRTKTTLVSSNMSGVSIYKDGNSVSIRLVGALTSAVSNGNLIGSIPTGYIPDVDWHFYCFGAGQMYRVLVRADGGLQASQDIPSGTAFRDTINYII